MKQALTFALITFFTIHVSSSEIINVRNPASQTISKLSPYTVLETDKFREKFSAKNFLLAHKAVNLFIQFQIKKEKKELGKEWTSLRTEIREINDPEITGNIKFSIKGLETIQIVRVTGLHYNTGQIAHIGLSGKMYTDLPTVYVDSALYFKYRSTILKHEIDEIKQWEHLRINLLRINNRSDMRKWIKKHINKADPVLQQVDYFGFNAKMLAQIYHAKSYSLDTIRKDTGLSLNFNYAYINHLISMYGLDSKDKDLNIAGHQENQENDIFDVDEYYPEATLNSTSDIKPFKIFPLISLFTIMLQTAILLSVLPMKGVLGSFPRTFVKEINYFYYSVLFVSLFISLLNFSLARITLKNIIPQLDDKIGEYLAGNILPGAVNSTSELYYHALFKTTYAETLIEDFTIKETINVFILSVINPLISHFILHYYFIGIPGFLPLKNWIYAVNTCIGLGLLILSLRFKPYSYDYETVFNDTVSTNPIIANPDPAGETQKEYLSLSKFKDKEDLAPLEYDEAELLKRVSRLKKIHERFKKKTAPQQAETPEAPSTAASYAPSEKPPETQKTLTIRDHQILSLFKENRFYEIRFNSDLLTKYEMSNGLDGNSNVKKAIIRYIQFLRLAAIKPENIALYGTSNKNYFLSVKCYKDRHKKELIGEMEISLNQLLEGQLIPVIEILDISFAMANIPKDIKKKDLEGYKALVKFIGEKYLVIYTEKLSAEKLVELLTTRNLTLPSARLFDTDELKKYYLKQRKYLESAA